MKNIKKCQLMVAHKLTKIFVYLEQILQMICCQSAWYMAMVFARTKFKGLSRRLAVSRHWW